MFQSLVGKLKAEMSNTRFLFLLINIFLLAADHMVLKHTTFELTTNSANISCIKLVHAALHFFPADMAFSNCPKKLFFKYK